MKKHTRTFRSRKDNHKHYLNMLMYISSLKTFNKKEVENFYCISHDAVRMMVKMGYVKRIDTNIYKWITDEIPSVQMVEKILLRMKTRKSTTPEQPSLFHNRYTPEVKREVIEKEVNIWYYISIILVFLLFTTILIAIHQNI